MSAACDTWRILTLALIILQSALINAQRHHGSRNRTAIRQLPGCVEYKVDLTCRTCERGYRAVRGKCECAIGYEKQGAECQPGPCYQKCGRTYLRAADGSSCHCDYFCNNRGDCCGGAPSKDALCPQMVPTKSKARITDGSSTINKQTRSARAGRVGSHQYMPGMCWCDEFCADAGDCCTRCGSSSSSSSRPDGSSGRPIGSGAGSRVKTRSNAAFATVSTSSLSVANSSSTTAIPPGAALNVQDDTHTEDVTAAIAAVTADSDTPLAQQIAAEAAAAAAKAGHKIDDCGSHRLLPGHQHGSSNGSSVSIAQATISSAMLQAEETMLKCQAEDKGPPSVPYVIPLHWTAGQVCRNGACTGGKYSAALVRQQITILNNMYARIGIQFSWDGMIHTATASIAEDIHVCFDPDGRCWVCQQQRFGDQVAINVMTSPIHVGGIALGVTMYPSYFRTGELPPCANWVYIYEKTLPGLGGRSLVDGGLADGGGTLAHEVGHALMLHHTWYEGGDRNVKTQCEGSASMEPYDILLGNSDGVRDTPAQSLNGSATAAQQSDILRFVQCDQRTGAYDNSTAYAQQSCTSKAGFPKGDSYYNNFGNLMSYGDKTCLRTLTPGQGARARCALKCMRQGRC